jgi:hypothetical protein
MIAQRLADRLSRSIGLSPAADIDTSLELPTAESGRLLGWASDGLSIVNVTPTGVVGAGDIDTTELADGAVTTAKLDSQAVTAVKLGDTVMGPGEIRNGTLAASVGSNALTVALKTLAGTDPSATDPVLIAFRSATATSGVVNVRRVTAATSLTVPNTATLGTYNAEDSTVTVLLMDNAGTVELAVANGKGETRLDTATSVTTTAIDTSADDDDVVYSTAARTALPFIVLGYVQSTQATAGTWAAAPTRVANRQDTARVVSHIVGPFVQDATSQTALNFTDIPNWARRITVHFYNVVSSDNGTAVGVQIGDSDGVDTAATYLGARSRAFSTNIGVGKFDSDASFYVANGVTSTYQLAGRMTLESATDGRVWTGAGQSAAYGATELVYGSAGQKALDKQLDRVRVIFSHAPTSGIVSVTYE